MSNILGLKTGPTETYKKNALGNYYYGDELDANTQPLLIQNVNDPRFLAQNVEGQYDNGEIVAKDNNPPAVPIEDKKVGPNGQEQRFPRETLEYLLRRAEPYASEAFVGGVNNSLDGFIELQHNKQDYNIYKELQIPTDDVVLNLDKYNNDPAQKSLFNPVYKEKFCRLLQ